MCRAIFFESTETTPKLVWVRYTTGSDGSQIVHPDELTKLVGDTSASEEIRHNFLRQRTLHDLISIYNVDEPNANALFNLSIYNSQSDTICDVARPR